MDTVLDELKRIREDVETRLNSLLDECAEIQQRQHAALEKVDGGDEVIDITQQQLDRVLSALREIIALNNARCAELARQLSTLPAKRTDLMIESLERRLETLEAEFRRGSESYEN